MIRVFIASPTKREIISETKLNNLFLWQSPNTERHLLNEKRVSRFFSAVRVMKIVFLSILFYIIAIRMEFVWILFNLI